MTGSSPHRQTTRRERAVLDELFDVLSKPARRHILTTLVDTKPGDAVEFDPADVISDERRADGLMGLYHIHLPKLDEAGVIEWNHGSKTITRGPRFDEIAPLVEVLIANQEELPVRWP